MRVSIDMYASMGVNASAVLPRIQRRLRYLLLPGITKEDLDSPESLWSYTHCLLEMFVVVGTGHDGLIVTMLLAHFCRRFQRPSEPACCVFHIHHCHLHVGSLAEAPHEPPP